VKKEFGPNSLTDDLKSYFFGSGGHRIPLRKYSRCLSTILIDKRKEDWTSPSIHFVGPQDQSQTSKYSGGTKNFQEKFGNLLHSVTEPYQWTFEIVGFLSLSSIFVQCHYNYDSVSSSQTSLNSIVEKGNKGKKEKKRKGKEEEKEKKKKK